MAVCLQRPPINMYATMALLLLTCVHKGETTAHSHVKQSTWMWVKDSQYETQKGSEKLAPLLPFGNEKLSYSL